MQLLKRSLIAIGFLSLALTGSALKAGYPPFGAWAYGSGWRYSSPGVHWHGGYYAGYTAVRYRSVYRPFAYARYRAWYPSMVVYTPAVSYPAFYYPAYSVPVVWPTYYSADVIPGYCATGAAGVSSEPLPVALASGVAPLNDTSTAQLVSIDYAASAGSVSNIPPELLSAADEIFRAGGYREAAAAYAQLNVRYGSSNQVFGRRFVAQVASGDFDQARVILESARLAGFEISRFDLPNGNLTEIFSGDARKVSMLTEQLAAKAIAAPSESEPMQMVGQWLKLAGDETRANLFLAMAEQLQGSVPHEELPMPSTPAKLVLLD